MSVYRQIKDKFIMRYAREDWAVYRSQLTDIILEKSPKSVMIVGAGRCNDIDLEKIAGMTEKVICVDVDEEAMQAAISAIPEEFRGRVECRNVSLTGISEADLEGFCDKLLTAARAEGRSLTENSFRTLLMSELDALKDKMVRSEEELMGKLPEKSVDTVVCCGVHSQLFSTVSFFIRSMISSLKDILPELSESEQLVDIMLHDMNNRVIPIIDNVLWRTAEKTVIFGNEYNPDNPVEGAEQCITYVGDHMNPEERHLRWEFNRAEGVTYNMMIQICE